MLRKIIKIDQEKCNGCNACADACHEGAISMINGKAKLIRDDYCDGLGDCLPACPTGAITFEEREAAEYDKAQVMANLVQKANQEKVDQAHSNANAKTACQSDNHAQNSDTPHLAPLPCGCPGSNAKAIVRQQTDCHTSAPQINAPATSQLQQWPVQIKLVPVKAPYFENANLLVAADCAAYAYGDFHNRFIKNRITLIGCPKLDQGDYAEKLTEIIKNNNLKSVTVVRMEVPCCGGIENAVKTALQQSGKMIPWQVVVISTDGEILE